ncbi:MAG TPA: ABC transporter ATP-binding protein, partial [Candidatus Nanopelagicaceae bacterium]|nr:ABC transporter ATP-binding protein [Candidatus Nanopelagicaceae bacterium]
MAPPRAAKDLRATLRQLVGRLRPEWGAIVASVVLSATGIALVVIAPRIIGTATNVIFNGVLGKALPAGLTKAQAVAYLHAHGEGQVAQMVSGTGVVPGKGIDLTQLGQLLGVVALLYLVGAVFSWMQGFIMAGVAQRTVQRMRRDVEDKLARLPLRYFDSHPHGDVLSRVTNDIDNITTTIQQGLSQLLTSGLTIVGVLAMMLLLSPVLAVISLITVPLSMGVTLLIARRSQVQFGAQWERTGSVNSLVEQTHTGHALVQVYGRSHRIMEDFEKENQGLYEPSFRAQFLSGIIQPAMLFLANLNYVAIAALGGYWVVSGSMTLGDIQAFIQYSRQFTNPISQIASQMNLLQSGLASAERVFEFLGADEEEAAVDRQRPPAPEGHVLLDQVSFRYAADRPLIEDFTLEVKPGETVAIVGPTGAGKTTVVNLLMRFYEIDSGHIYLDGVDAALLSRESVRSRFGMVLQDTWLFAGSIKDNIAYGRVGATEEEVLAAARAAFVAHFIRTLPEGYETLLDADAGNISAGQRQLLT